MIAPELLMAWAAMIVAALWIVRLELALRRKDEILDSVEEALEAADEAIDMYHRTLTNVAIGHTKLELTHDGQIIETAATDREVPRH